MNSLSGIRIIHRQRAAEPTTAAREIGGTNENGDPLLSEFSYMVLEGADKLDSACNITVRDVYKRQISFTMALLRPALLLKQRVVL